MSNRGHWRVRARGDARIRNTIGGASNRDVDKNHMKGRSSQANTKTSGAARIFALSLPSTSETFSGCRLVSNKKKETNPISDTQINSVLSADYSKCLISKTSDSLGTKDRCEVSGIEDEEDIFVDALENLDITQEDKNEAVRNSSNNKRSLDGKCEDMPMRNSKYISYSITKEAEKELPQGNKEEIVKHGHGSNKHCKPHGIGMDNVHRRNKYNRLSRRRAARMPYVRSSSSNKIQTEFMKTPPRKKLLKTELTCRNKTAVNVVSHEKDIMTCRTKRHSDKEKTFSIKKLGNEPSSCFNDKTNMTDEFDEWNTDHYGLSESLNKPANTNFFERKSQVKINLKHEYDINTFQGTEKSLHSVDHVSEVVSMSNALIHKTLRNREMIVRNESVNGQVASDAEINYRNDEAIFTCSNIDKNVVALNNVESDKLDLSILENPVRCSTILLSKEVETISVSEKSIDKPNNNSLNNSNIDNSDNDSICSSGHGRGILRFLDEEGSSSGASPCLSPALSTRSDVSTPEMIIEGHHSQDDNITGYGPMSDIDYGPNKPPPNRIMQHSCPFPENYIRGTNYFMDERLQRPRFQVAPPQPPRPFIGPTRCAFSSRQRHSMNAARHPEPRMGNNGMKMFSNPASCLRQRFPGSSACSSVSLAVEPIEDDLCEKRGIKRMHSPKQNKDIDASVQSHGTEAHASYPDEIYLPPTPLKDLQDQKTFPNLNVKIASSYPDNNMPEVSHACGTGFNQRSVDFNETEEEYNYRASSRCEISPGWSTPHNSKTTTPEEELDSSCHSTLLKERSLEGSVCRSLHKELDADIYTTGAKIANGTGKVTNQFSEANLADQLDGDVKICMNLNENFKDIKPMYESKCKWGEDMESNVKDGPTIKEVLTEEKEYMKRLYCAKEKEMASYDYNHGHDCAPNYYESSKDYNSSKWNQSHGNYGRDSYVAYQRSVEEYHQRGMDRNATFKKFQNHGDGNIHKGNNFYYRNLPSKNPSWGHVRQDGRKSLPSMCLKTQIHDDAMNEHNKIQQNTIQNRGVPINQCIIDKNELDENSNSIRRSSSQSGLSCIADSYCEDDSQESLGNEEDNGSESVFSDQDKCGKDNNSKHCITQREYTITASEDSEVNRDDIRDSSSSFNIHSPDMTSSKAMQVTIQEARAKSECMRVIRRKQQLDKATACLTDWNADKTRDNENRRQKPKFKTTECENSRIFGTNVNLSAPPGFQTNSLNQSLFHQTGFLKDSQKKLANIALQGTEYDDTLNINVNNTTKCFHSDSEAESDQTPIFNNNPILHSRPCQRQRVMLRPRSSPLEEGAIESSSSEFDWFNEVDKKSSKCSDRKAQSAGKVKNKSDGRAILGCNRSESPNDTSGGKMNPPPGMAFWKQGYGGAYSSEDAPRSQTPNYPSNQIHKRIMKMQSQSAPTRSGTRLYGSGAVEDKLSMVCWKNWKDKYRESFQGISSTFIDTHCHIDFLFDRSNFAGTYKQYMEVNADTFLPNYEGCVAIFCNPRTFNTENALWRSLLGEAGVYIAVGCHPKSATDFSIKYEHGMTQMLKHERVVAVGEIGLDYSGTFSQHSEIQKLVLIRQCKIAMNLKKPIVIHSRDSEQDIIEVLAANIPRNYKIHRHCFTGSWEEADTWLKKFPNSYIGLTPLVTWYNSERAQGPREVARKIPLDKLLLETDAPYFLPRGIPKEEVQLSHPGYAITVAREVARLKGVPLETVLIECRINTRNMYSI